MKKIIIFLITLLIVTGCGKEDSLAKEDKVKEEVVTQNKTLSIKVNVENKDSNKGYMVYLLAPSEFKTGGEAIQSGYIKPVETDEEGIANFDLLFNSDLEWYLDQENSKMRVIIATKEDKYLRNPLNEETYVEFTKNNDEVTRLEYPYYSNIDKLTLNVKDEFKEGVLSLTFPDATFVIKLEFTGSIPKNSYEVSIHRPNSDGTGIGMYRLGRIARDFQYWDTPFFKTDNLKAWSGTIVVRNFDTNAEVSYVGYPKRVTFDESGKCTEGDIITIVINN